jgi:hypothetical protein
MKISKTLVVASALVLAVAAFGQGAGRQGGAAGPQGPRQGGGMFRGGGARILLLPAVQKELKMTKDQITKAEAAFGRQGGPGAGAGGSVNRGGAQGGNQNRGGAGSTTQGGRGQGGPGAGMTDAQREQRRLETEKQVKGILNATQFTRYNQLTLQMSGASALLRPDVAKKVGLTTQQQTKIREIQQKQMESLRSRFQGGAQGGGQNRGGAGANGDMRAQFEKLRSETNTKILAVLSANQKKTWQGMLGTPFKFQ